jgi:hypothetical protein
MGRPGVIPAWKVRRELGRLGQQLRAIPEAVWEPFARRAHDRALARGFPQMDGALALAPKVALVLCWQPRGLAPSFLDMLDHLVTCGYAPFVVSNAPLSSADRQSLHPRIWRAVERPNFGYDFGGYRDGLFLLRRWGIRPDRLVILNDSIWFPLWPDDQTLQRAEAAPFDVTGTILRQRDAIAFLESYFFSIRGLVLDHPGFRAFWEGLRLTSNKYKVIRRGERGFGLALKAAGISFGPLFPQAGFDAALAGMDASALRQVLAHMAAVDPTEAAEGAALARAPETPDWAVTARAFVARVLEKSQIYSAFPVAAAGVLGYPVLKKSMEPVSTHWRAAFLRAVDAGVLRAPLPAILAEARARAKKAT